MTRFPKMWRLGGGVSAPPQCKPSSRAVALLMVSPWSGSGAQERLVRPPAPASGRAGSCPRPPAAGPPAATARLATRPCPRGNDGVLPCGTAPRQRTGTPLAARHRLRRRLPLAWPPVPGGPAGQSALHPRRDGRAQRSDTLAGWPLPAASARVKRPPTCGTFGQARPPRPRSARSAASRRSSPAGGSPAAALSRPGGPAPWDRPRERPIQSRYTDMPTCRESAAARSAAHRGGHVTSSVGIVASGITARGPEGPIFQGVDLEAEPGSLVAVTGPGGCGRTALLLALAGRFRLVAGQLVVGGHQLP